MWIVLSKNTCYTSPVSLPSQIMTEQIQPWCKTSDFHEAEAGFEVRRVQVIHYSLSPKRNWEVMFI